MVSLLLKLDPKKYLKSNYKISSQLLSNLERQLDKNNLLSKKYTDFMLEYKGLTHMAESNHLKEDGYFIPHHGVFKKSDPTDIWVVFSGWRFHKVAFTADVVKMYRQFLILPEDRVWQSTLWRDDRKQTPTCFDINTVTYGLTSSPFIALLVLEQLAVE
ncbi:uncharacterized protein LOC111693860 [Trichogramma pretiosum]|uniref:uncharacterized protein LOC111693860 n=1 Tax=Trichogramma pretiosum TaxID=7493 RepID=UPI000C71B40D|nr:uncharacterized protein LOC111693860 [Trichogramma pretiosum]